MLDSGHFLKNGLRPQSLAFTMNVEKKWQVCFILLWCKEDKKVVSENYRCQIITKTLNTFMQRCSNRRDMMLRSFLMKKMNLSIQTTETP